MPWSRRRRWLLPFVVFVVLGSWLISHYLNQLSVKGVVTVEGRPVAGARVRLQKTDQFAVTDENGRFRLSRTKGERVTAWKEGFFIAGAPLSTSPLAIALTPFAKRRQRRL